CLGLAETEDAKRGDLDVRRAELMLEMAEQRCIRVFAWCDAFFAGHDLHGNGFRNDDVEQVEAVGCDLGSIGQDPERGVQNIRNAVAPLRHAPAGSTSDAAAAKRSSPKRRANPSSSVVRLDGPSSTLIPLSARTCRNCARGKPAMRAPCSASRSSR